MVSVLRGVVDHGVAFTPQNYFQIPDLSAGEALSQQPLHAKVGSNRSGSEGSNCEDESEEDSSRAKPVRQSKKTRMSIPMEAEGSSQ